MNDGAAAAAGSIEAPMGGMRDSGLGRRHGAEGIRKYTEAQTIAVQRLLPLAPPKQLTLAQYAVFITKQLKLFRALRLPLRLAMLTNDFDERQSSRVSLSLGADAA